MRPTYLDFAAYLGEHFLQGGANSGTLGVERGNEFARVSMPGYDSTKPFKLKRHASLRAAERGIPLEAIQSAMVHPDEVEPHRHEGFMQLRVIKRFQGWSLTLAVDFLEDDDLYWVWSVWKEDL
jgi:hypothetical protein